MTPEQIQAYKDVCVAGRRYYWIYTPKLFMEKVKDTPTYLGDSVILKHLKGTMVLGLSPFVDNDNVLYASNDFDVHPFTPGEIKRRQQEKETPEQIKQAEDEYLQEQRKRIKEDIPKIEQWLKSKGYLYFLNSSGSEGIHLRIYSNKPTNAKVMRYFLINIQEQVLGEVRHEIFPKQDCLNEATPFGNQMKSVLAIHPRTKRLAGIIKDGKVLDREQSLNFLVEFSNKIKSAKTIEFDIPPEMEIKHKKSNFKAEFNAIDDKNIPCYCGGFENVGCKNILPSGKASRHDYLDGNAYKYLQDKPQLFEAYCSIQGRDLSAFNRCQDWVWSCEVIQKYLNNNTGKSIDRWQEECSKCKHYKPKGWANSVSIIKLADKYNFKTCPKCNTSFNFNDKLGWFKCDCMKGGLTKFAELISEVII